MCRPPPSLSLGLALALAVSLALALLPSPGWSADEPERGLKVVYLYNFTRFIDWPDAAIGNAFVIAVVGDPDLAEALKVLERRGKRAEGRPIRVRVADAASNLDDVQILFVGARAVTDLPRIRSDTEGKPILLVGDSAGLARRGVAINFFLKPDIVGDGQRLRFEINPSVLTGRGLDVMADLYDVAEIVQ
jgi:hypothetical protein